jgi:hypothetical protein
MKFINAEYEVQVGYWAEGTICKITKSMWRWFLCLMRTFWTIYYSLQKTIHGASTPDKLELQNSILKVIWLSIEICVSK